MEEEVLIIKPGELFLKSSHTRRRFEKILYKNIKAYLKQKELDYDYMQRDQSRIFVYTDDTEDAFQLKNVFGIISLSAAVQVGVDLEIIKKTTLELLKKHKLTKAKTFAVRVKRATKELPMTSLELAQEVGKYIQEKTKAKVDLKKPDKEVFIEIIRNRAFIFTKVIRGHGGLPIGTQGKVICLMSDSAKSKKAAFTMLKRGCEIIPLHLRTDEKKHLKFLKNAKDLQDFSIGHKFKPLSLRWDKKFNLKDAVIEAENIAKENDAKAIVLGKIPNLKKLKDAQEAVKLPILTPLVK
jgi:thiamine biosynthesis protein ThiI